MNKDEIIIFDIDGTVVDSPEQKMPSTRMIDAFKLCNDKYVMSAATGRPWTFAKEIIQSVTTSPSIVAGGSQIRSVNGNVLWQCSIPDSVIDEILEILQACDNLSLLWNDYEESKYLNDEGVATDQLPKNEQIYFLEVIYVSEKEALNLKKQLDQIEGITITLVFAQRTGLIDIHITNEFATKEHAIAELLKIAQIDVDRTIGVGDGHNDLHLFAAVKEKIAMGNAVEELKERASKIIGSVKDDGLAIYLESLV